MFKGLKMSQNSPIQHSVPDPRVPLETPSKPNPINDPPPNRDPKSPEGDPPIENR